MGNTESLLPLQNAKVSSSSVCVCVRACVSTSAAATGTYPTRSPLPAWCQQWRMLCTCLFAIGYRQAKLRQQQQQQHARKPAQQRKQNKTKHAESKRILPTRLDLQRDFRCRSNSLWSGRAPLRRIAKAAAAAAPPQQRSLFKQRVRKRVPVCVCAYWF